MALKEEDSACRGLLLFFSKVPVAQERTLAMNFYPINCFLFVQKINDLSR